MHLCHDCHCHWNESDQRPNHVWVLAGIMATVVSLVLSLIVWYIVDGKTAGVNICPVPGQRFRGLCPVLKTLYDTD